MTSHEPALSNDELRRQLRETDRAHAAALPRWRDALRRTFDPDARVSPEAKAQLLGLPDRRGFLTIGGAAVAMSMVAAACSGVDEDQLPIGGTTPPSLDKEVYETGRELDITLLRTAQSIEVLAIDTYRAVLDANLLTTPAVADAARLFMEQHQDHAGLLATTTEDSGGEVYDQANPYLLENVVAPAQAAVTDEEMAVALAFELENTAAQTYVFAAELLSTPELRQAIMSIGGVEARHVAVLYGVQQQPQVPFAFMPRRARVPDKGFLPEGA